MPKDTQRASESRPDEAQSGASKAERDAARKDERSRPKEIGGRDGPDPTRYGDWEKAGRCIDF